MCSECTRALTFENFFACLGKLKCAEVTDFTPPLHCALAKTKKMSLPCNQHSLPSWTSSTFFFWFFIILLLLLCVFLPATSTSSRLRTSSTSFFFINYYSFFLIFLLLPATSTSCLSWTSSTLLLFFYYLDSYLPPALLPVLEPRALLFLFIQYYSYYYFSYLPPALFPVLDLEDLMRSLVGGGHVHTLWVHWYYYCLYIIIISKITFSFDSLRPRGKNKDSLRPRGIWMEIYSMEE